MTGRPTSQCPVVGKVLRAFLVAPLNFALEGAARPYALNRRHKSAKFKVNKRLSNPRRTIAISSQRMFKHAAHSTACRASSCRPLSQQRSIPLSCFMCPMAGSMAWRRLSHLRDGHEGLVLAPVNQFHRRLCCLFAAKAQIDPYPSCRVQPRIVLSMLRGGLKNMIG